MVQELLGPTMEDLFNFCDRKFSVKTSVMIFKQMIERLEHVHGLGVINRDVKPENMMMGLREKSSVVHMIDFGIARSYIDKKTKKHIEFQTGKNLVGTARYVSVNAHLGYTLSRRDDLLTLGYVMVYFAAGELPWQFENTRRKSARFTDIGRIKKSYSPAQLCRQLPIQFRKFFEYCNKLEFEETPDYKYLIGLMNEAADYHGFNIDDG